MRKEDDLDLSGEVGMSTRREKRKVLVLKLKIAAYIQLVGQHYLRT
jgi:hypothetical protein